MVDRLIGPAEALSPDQRTKLVHQELLASNDYSPRDTAIVDHISQSPFLLVVDPEKAVADLKRTRVTAEVFIEEGGKTIIVGGSTDNGKDSTESEATVRALVEARGDRKVLLIAFPGSRRQVVPGIPTMALHLPQVYPVFSQHPELKGPMCEEYEAIVAAGLDHGRGVIAVNYLLFDSGKRTSVQEQTGIPGFGPDIINDEARIRMDVLPYARRGLTILEQGSRPGEFMNLGLLADFVYRNTGNLPIATGGVSSPERVRAITKHYPFPLGIGTIAEVTTPEEFRGIFREMQMAHKSARH